MLDSTPTYFADPQCVRIHEPDLPELGYEYENPTGHDAVCGTYSLNYYQLPHPECPQKFVCDTESASVSDEPIRKSDKKFIGVVSTFSLQS
jgi:hypothetical protein